MPSIGRTIFYLPETEEICEFLPTGYVASQSWDGLVLRAAYLSESETTGNGLINARQRLVLNPPNTILRIVQSMDGPPFRSAIVYVEAGESNVHREIAPLSSVRAVRYVAPPISNTYTWENDATSGRPGFFLTGTTGASALWRLSRIEADALGRQVLTLAPVRLAHGIATPRFDLVSQPLQAFLKQHFEEFQRAMARNAYFDVIDRANNLAEGILEHCLNCIGSPTPKTLSDRLKEAQMVLEDPQRRAGFPLTRYAYHLAHKIRLLHARLHADQAVGQGKTVRPEVGMSAAIDVCELLVEVDLANY